jgi:16S rRNA (guanine527-N7)-methyltransferase
MAHKNQSNVSPMKSRQGTHHRKPQQVFTEAEANDRLYDLFKRHGAAHISHAERIQMARFYALLMQQQKKDNFTRLLDLRDIAIKHFIDCALVPQIAKLQFPLLDLGTGPGFPGIPLKILFPKEPIVLAEGVQRRVEFLKLVREDMKLEALPIIGRNINPYFAYPVQGVITRAVEDIRNTLTNVLTCLQTGGRVYFMKGPNVDPEIELAAKESGGYYQLIQNTAYDIPQTPHQRRLVVYEKIKQAPLPDFEDEPWPEDD